MLQAQHSQRAVASVFVSSKLEICLQDACLQVIVKALGVTLCYVGTSVRLSVVLGSGPRSWRLNVQSQRVGFFEIFLASVQRRAFSECLNLLQYTNSLYILFLSS